MALFAKLDNDAEKIKVMQGDLALRRDKQEGDKMEQLARIDKLKADTIRSESMAIDKQRKTDLQEQQQQVDQTLDIVRTVEGKGK